MLLTYLVNLGLQKLRRALGKANLSRKTLIDERFLS
jgi:hypothetical protein